MRRGTNMEFAGLTPFSPEIRSVAMPVEMKLPTFTMFSGKTDPENHGERGNFILPDRFQREFNLVPSVDQKIVIIAFIEGLRMSMFQESLVKKRHVSLGEVNERSYKYIRIEEAAKWDEKGHGKCPMEEDRRMSPKPKWRSALDRIRRPDRGYSRADLPLSSAFSHLQDEQKKKVAKEGEIEYLTPLSASIGNIFMDVEDKRILPRPPK
ncbi:hypothetical protein LIER_26769 [Lithospermum erythrorhizon]|uniref:Uncharacterized protein n=1 Tax=Lithospermum erythrorhizon TaxID=34254 RepID=A0AAV3RCZ3_LITER